MTKWSLEQLGTGGQAAFLALLGMAIGCGEPPPPRTAAGAEVLRWESARTFGADGLSEGEAIGTDSDRIVTVVFSPRPIEGMFAPRVPPLELEVTYTVGERSIRRDDGTSFRALVPVRASASAVTASDWVVTARCDDTIAAPMPSSRPDGSLAYLDGARFSEACVLDIAYQESTRATLGIDVLGDGTLDAHASAGAVTVARL